MRQARGKSLRDYITRFNAELTIVERCEGGFTLATLWVGLQQGLFWKSLMKMPLENNVELLERPQK